MYVLIRTKNFVYEIHMHTVWIFIIYYIVRFINVRITTLCIILNIQVTPWMPTDFQVRLTIKNCLLGVTLSFSDFLSVFISGRFCCFCDPTPENSHPFPRPLSRSAPALIHRLLRVYFCTHI